MKKLKTPELLDHSKKANEELSRAVCISVGLGDE